MAGCRWTTWRVLLAALALLVGSTALGAVAAPLPTYEATYRVEYKGMYVGDALFSMQRAGVPRHYVFESRTRAKGLAKLLRRRPAVERSEFAVRDNRIVPLRYTFDDGSRQGKRSNQVQFDWERGIATSSYKGVTVEIPLQTGILDRMTMQTAVMRDMASPSGPAPEYALIQRNALNHYRYELQETTTIDTELGSLLTKAYLQTSEGSSRRLRVWVAPSLRHMAVRMEQQRDGNTETVFTLKDLTFHPQQER